MPGDVSGPAGQRPNTQQGGLAIRVNAIDLGVRGNVNFNDTPGVRWTGADQPAPSPARMTVTAELDAEVLFATATGVDLVPGGALETLLSAIAQTRIQISRILVVAENVSGVTVQPTLEAGTDISGNPPNNDIASSQTLGLTATDQIEELTLQSVRPSIDQTAPNDVLRVRQNLAATATNYVVGLLIYGTVVNP